MKNLLNNLSNEEKNRIREQHKGGMSIDTSKFKKLMESKLGNVKPLINEQVTGDTLDGQTIMELIVKSGSIGSSVKLSNGKTYTYTTEDVTTFPQMVYSGWCGPGTYTADQLPQGCSATVTLGTNLRFECDKQGCKKVDDIE